MSLVLHRCCCFLLGLLAFSPLAVEAAGLRIGVTLHPYYSFVANIVGDRARLVPLIDAGFNPHAYEPRAEDIKRIGQLDVVVLNDVGHDDFARKMITASERPDLPVIAANAEVPLLSGMALGAPQGRAVNPHTFLSITASMLQVSTIARALGRLDPENAGFYQDNARNYNRRLRQLRAEAFARIKALPSARQSASRYAFRRSISPSSSFSRFSRLSRNSSVHMVSFKYATRVISRKLPAEKPRRS